MAVASLSGDGILVDEKGGNAHCIDHEIPTHHGSARTRPMRVLNLGLFRTGTSSFREALSILGFQNIYHMSYVFTERPQDSELWLKAFDAKYRSKRPETRLTREDWDSVLGDCDAVSDFPCAAFSEELIEAYPEAKVILTVRDSPEVWYESVMNTVWYAHSMSPFASGKLLGHPLLESWLPKLFRMGKRMFGDVFDGSFPANGIDVYRSHSEIIQRLVDEDRLLVFNVKEGWTPLCNFLGLELPKDAGPFPRVNEGQAVVDKVLAKQNALRGSMRRIGYSLLASVAVSAVLYTVYRPL
ncbi:hypothetical protein KC343_g1809 [Hortaea werneckii]|uniref:NAD dependent epimerase/dehydratase n=1 Tax=Hortaea werneckii TaxID=91943 RepID=A0A3M7HAE1_HORWE|nr:hypothetical protein KC352_g6851 [Hortaea werneckii]KAI7573050.1 hypothetical protein KC317_g218 [Hortaea werneckii]KAI7628379.1 hypothetical protein KC346_g209 [Hortaea werneckii]KAI7635448.1 hypothetical protein KC343_g1809 [Hortaea werneckii]KAI7679160.1 hypothetical protein KC319_g2925 [Hortaea werneckii]